MEDLLRLSSLQTWSGDFCSQKVHWHWQKVLQMWLGQVMEHISLDTSTIFNNLQQSSTIFNNLQQSSTAVAVAQGLQPYSVNIPICSAPSKAIIVAAALSWRHWVLYWHLCGTVLTNLYPNLYRETVVKE